MDNLQHGVPVLLERGVGNFEAVLVEDSYDVVERSYTFQVIHEYNVDARADIKNLDQRFGAVFGNLDAIFFLQFSRQASFE
nr:hypothetical protein Iba_chr09aCG13020 [Ipomoea batatas]